MIRTWLDRLLKWLVVRFGGDELLQLILVWVTLGCVGIGLTGVIKELDFGFMMGLIPVSVLGAWLLTRASWTGWMVGPTGSLLGLSGLMLTVGKMGRPLLALLASAFSAVGQWLRGCVVGFSTETGEQVRQCGFDSSPVTVSWRALVESFAALVGRLDHWFGSLRSGITFKDPLAITFLCGLAFCLVTLWALWWVRRRGHVMAGLLPAIAFLAYFIYLNGSVKQIIWLVLACGGMLLLQAAGHYAASLRRWMQQHLQRVEIEQTLVFGVSLLTISMMLAGGLLPTIPTEKIRKAIDDALHTHRHSSTSTTEYYQPSTGIPNPAVPHTIGAGPDPSDAMIMYVSVDGYNPVPETYVAAVQQSEVRYYWQSQTYDLYTGKGWSTKAIRIEEKAADQPLLPGVDPAIQSADYRLVTQHITRFRSEEDVTFAAGELLQLDQPSTTLWNDFGVFIAARTDADIYTAVSHIQSPSVEELRSAGTDYPPSLAPYLQLPDSLPPRVRDLAISLTINQPSAYNKAAVLEAYLYQFPYSLDVSSPPSDRDAVDFFLFDLKKGYCDYFASAMVVMVRAAGLPARMVIGYTSGIYDFQAHRFEVRALNAHAWAQVYFPGIGWVDFDPTSNQPLPYRPGEKPEAATPASLPPPGQQAPFQFTVRRLWQGGLPQKMLGVLAAAVICYFLPFETWWLMLLPTDRALKTIFRRLYRRGRAFHIQPNPSRTPDEFTRVLVANLQRFAGDENQAGLVSALCADLNRLTGVYDRMLFSEVPLRKEEKQEAVRAWVRVRRELRRVRS